MTTAIEIAVGATVGETADTSEGSQGKRRTARPKRDVTFLPSHP